jgi:hypothetical protein
MPRIGSLAGWYCTHLGCRSRIEVLLLVLKVCKSRVGQGLYKRRKDIPGMQPGVTPPSGLLR